MNEIRRSGAPERDDYKIHFQPAFPAAVVCPATLQKLRALGLDRAAPVRSHGTAPDRLLLAANHVQGYFKVFQNLCRVVGRDGKRAASIGTFYEYLMPFFILPDLYRGEHAKMHRPRPVSARRPFFAAGLLPLLLSIQPIYLGFCLVTFILGLSGLASHHIPLLNKTSIQDQDRDRVLGGSRRNINRPKRAASCRGHPAGAPAIDREVRRTGRKSAKIAGPAAPVRDRRS
jgi:hypothetical protein